MAPVSGQTQGRRGYYLYEYGTHLWFPQTQADFSAGIYQDVNREQIPANGCYDAIDLLLDKPGVARRRGGSSYVNSTGVIVSYFGTVTYMNAIVEVFFPGIGTQIVGVTDLGDIVEFFNASTAFGVAQGVVTGDKPKLFVGGGKNLLVITDASGVQVPVVWDGTASPRSLGGTTQTLAITGTPTGGSITVTATEAFVGDSATIVYNSTNTQAKTALDGMSSISGTFTVTGGALPGTALVITYGTTGDCLGLKSDYNHLTGGTAPAATLVWNNASNVPKAQYSAIHLSRIVLASTLANPNRIFFSPVPDPTTSWSSTSYVDANNPITGLAVVNGSLLVFSQGHLEKFVGDTPPPGTNFTHLTVDAVGCADARSITVAQGVCYFANRSGVYRTDGVTVQSITEGKIGRLWRSSISGFSIMSMGIYARRHLVVQVLDGSRNLLFGAMFDTVTGAWGRLSGNVSTMFASSQFSGSTAVYGAAAGSANILALSGMWTPTSSNKADADGTAVAPVLETRPFGGGPDITAFGKAHLTYDMRDAASDDPTLAVAIATGTEATTYAAVAESPLAETTDARRARVSTGKARGSQALSVKLTQTGPSAKTEIYALEMDTRGFPREAGGQ